ncbi:MAG TPA: protein kinase [Candidatus Fimicola cottocaccae]|nr:protein kinase [Candidatus Fimicola cottocaccae]
MSRLLRDDCIYIGSEKYYRLIENSKEKKRTFCTTWSAVVEDVKSFKKYFLKYTMSDDKEGISVLKKESQFKMYYPYIEHIYGDFWGIDDDDNEIYGVLGEYIEGMTMREYREKYKIISDEKIFRYMLQLLYAVRHYTDFIKDDPYVHRDLKPDNIMINTKYDKAMIIDFDWAHIYKSTDTQRQETIGGTFGYSDPRAYQSNITDIKMDIYALGRVFFFWLKGRDYFSEDECKMYRHFSCDDLAYSFDKERLPEKYKQEKYCKLIKIISKMVDFPEKRYSKISDIIDDMKKFLIEFFEGIENYQSIFGDNTILRIPEDRYIKDAVTVGYCCSSDNKRISVSLEEYRMHDIIVEGQIIMCIYNIKGSVYYVPISPKIEKKTEYDDDTYRISDGDIFYYDDKVIDFIM